MDPETHTVPSAPRPYRWVALRIVLTVVVWCGLPWLFLILALSASSPLGYLYGFLGDGFFLVAFLILAFLTAIIYTAGSKTNATLGLIFASVTLVLVLIVNQIDAVNPHLDANYPHAVDSLTYDRDTARQLAESNLENGPQEYTPFISDAIARLDEPSTLRFMRDDLLPKVDCAAALLPLMSSFVTATYPVERTSASWVIADAAEAEKSGYFAGFDAGFVAKGGRMRGGVPEPTEEELHDPSYVKGYQRGYKHGSRAGAEGVGHDSQQYFNFMELPEPNAFREEHATVQYNNSATGFMKLAERDTDIFFGTKADSRQADELRAHGVELEYTPICREGFVFLVNASNPVDSLTVQQVKDIYAGRITNWSEVGGEDEPITAYQRNANSGSQSRMEQFMEGDALMEAPTELHLSTMGGLVESVADYDNGRNAIGYSFRYYVTDLVGDYDVKLLAIDGVEPTLETITDGSYPLTGDFYAVTRQGDGNEDVGRLISWIRGPQGQELVRASGYAPLAQ